MKKRVLALALAGGVLLSGCKAMLERSYEAIQRHEERPAAAADASGLRVENYRELVSAVLYLVSQGQEEGVLQLYNYDGEVETDLTRACLEVATEDPLGAYAVDYIRHETSHVVSHYQVRVSISYRRTLEEIRSIVNVTGSGAIRDQLQEALSQFSDQAVLRVAYFAEEEASIRALAQQAYYDSPAAALGMPQIDIRLYPDSGRERVVEILLTYSHSAEELRRRSQALTDAAAQFVYPRDMDPEAAVRQAAADVCSLSSFDPAGDSTAYAALVRHSADDEGLALAYALVCRELWDVTCEIVEGTLQGEPHFWNTVRLPQGETFCLDLSRFTELSSTLYTAEEMAELGYRRGDEPAEEEPPPAEAAPAQEGQEENSGKM